MYSKICDEHNKKWKYVHLSNIKKGSMGKLMKIFLENQENPSIT